MKGHTGNDQGSLVLSVIIITSIIFAADRVSESQSKFLLAAYRRQDMNKVTAALLCLLFMSFFPSLLTDDYLNPTCSSAPSYVLLLQYLLSHQVLSLSSKPTALPCNALIGLPWIIKDFVCGLFPQEIIFSLILETLF